jgi:hypothetical protein
MVTPNHISNPPNNSRLVILIQPGDKLLKEKTFAVTARWTVSNSIGEWVGEATGKILSVPTETYWIECPIGT